MKECPQVTIIRLIEQLASVKQQLKETKLQLLEAEIRLLTHDKRIRREEHDPGKKPY